MPMSEINQDMLSGLQPFANVFDILLTKNPAAYARIKSSGEAGIAQEDIDGYVFLFTLQSGTLVAACVTGLPKGEGVCAPHFFGFHIHEGDVHYNPADCLHPYHAGDFPPLLSSSGFSWQMFYTGYFKPDDVIGDRVVIHEHEDDFTSQPSGNPGNMMASGIIKEYPFQNP